MNTGNEGGFANYDSKCRNYNSKDWLIQIYFYQISGSKTSKKNHKQILKCKWHAGKKYAAFGTEKGLITLTNEDALQINKENTKESWKNRQ